MSADATQVEDSTRHLTPEQARAELARRRRPKDERHEGRAEAMACGSFYVSRAALEAIAEGGS